jgi:hypothetical protein
MGEWSFNDRYAWNFHMLTATFGNDDGPTMKTHWLLPLVHGHVDQASMSFLFIVCIEASFVNDI